MRTKQKKILLRIILTSVLVLVLNIVKFPPQVKLLLFIFTYLLIGYDVLRKAFLGIKNRRLFDENFLMSVATIGAFTLAIYSKSQDYNEAVAVMLFYQIGEFFQSCAVDKSRKNISELMDIKPQYANIEKNGTLVKVPPEDVETGSIIVVKPGEKIPIDGIVIEGEGSLNTSAITGESAPKNVKVNSEVISGCINLNGVLKIKTTKPFEDSAVSKILELVENSSSNKSKSENFISRFARIYTPIVCYSALAIAIIPPIVSLILGAPPLWFNWIYKALIFLVVSCPCALVISIPLSFFAAIGGASKKGILLKGSNYLEALSHTKSIFFDKTGTLTEGVFEVSGIHHSIIEEKKLLEIAAHAECGSNHPISKSIQEAYGGTIDRSRVKNVEEISGYGLKATVDNIDVIIGNGKLFAKLGIPYISCKDGTTVAHIALNNKYAGHILISDKVKKSSKNAIQELKKLNINDITILTGDSKKVAEAVGESLDVANIYSELTPLDKVKIVEEKVKNQVKNDSVVFVGDGINDAPVLTKANIGVAMGAIGSDAAIEASDVVIIDDDPLKIVTAIKISRKCNKIVKENIIFALVIKALCLILSLFGIVNMWIAIFADVGVMVLAVLNALRVFKTKNL